MSTVRRRIGQVRAARHWFDECASGSRRLFDRQDDDDRRAASKRFCAAFPDDREHRWVRDLAAEVLHYVDPERYPLMTRWVWDARTNTGVLREIWHGEDVDSIRIDVADGYATFLVLREELAQYLAANGVFRDVLCVRRRADGAGVRRLHRRARRHRTCAPTSPRPRIRCCTCGGSLA